MSSERCPTTNRICPNREILVQRLLQNQETIANAKHSLQSKEKTIVGKLIAFVERHSVEWARPETLIVEYAQYKNKGLEYCLGQPCEAWRTGDCPLTDLALSLIAGMDNVQRPALKLVPRDDL